MIKGCPCKHVKPCTAQCTCVSSFSSAGCLRCCTYGDHEQQRAAAERLANAEYAARTAVETLRIIAGWNCLNMPNSSTGCSDLCSDFPWLKKLVNDALEKVK